MADTEQVLPKEEDAASPPAETVKSKPTEEVNGAEREGAKIQDATPSSAPNPAPREAEAAVKLPPNSEIAGTGKSNYSDDNEVVRKLVNSGKLSQQEVQAVKGLAKDHATLKVKVDRVKALLGRSAKAQREAKVELEVTQKRLEQVLRDSQRLKDKVDHLSSRPTHMDLLNDFETNFDRALLSVGQTGGEDTAAPVAQPSIVDNGNSALDAMLMQELEECRNRLVKLESLNGALVRRASQLEADARDRKKERDDAMQKLSHMELELRMSRMEASHAQRAMEEKAASLEEMQMEIELVTKSSMKANVRAAQGEAVAKSSKTDRQHVVQLEAQVQALKEWALASTESKRLALERVSILEKKLQMQGEKCNTSEEDGKTIYSKSGSLVVGAAATGHLVVDLKNHINTGARLLLKWKFDASPSDYTTYFNIMKDRCQTSKQQAGASYLIRDRAVTGGAAGELEGVFSDQNECTLLWSNAQSWIRPRTVKYSIEVISYGS